MGQTKKLTLTLLMANLLTVTLQSEAKPAKPKTPDKKAVTDKSASTAKSKPAAKPLPNPAPGAASTPLTAGAAAAAELQAPVGEMPVYVFLLPKEGLTRYQRMSYELDFAMGKPGNQALVGTANHWALSAHYYYTSYIDFSLYYRKTSASGVDNVTFDTTYTENRSYAIGVTMMGAGARYRFKRNQSIELRTGISKTSSTLTAIGYDAPLGPTLTVGYEKPIPSGIPIDIQYAYEFRKPKYGGALTASYTMSAFGKNESTAEIAVGISLRFYTTPWEKILLEQVPAFEQGLSVYTAPGAPGAGAPVLGVPPAANVRPAVGAVQAPKVAAPVAPPKAAAPKAAPVPVTAPKSP